MQKDSRFFEDMAKVASSAAGSVVEMSREIESQVHAQVEKILQKMDLATSEEVQTVLQMQSKIREEQEKIIKRLENIEKRLDQK